MKYIKSTLSELGHRALAHWKTSLIGAIEGSGLTAASLLSGDATIRNGMIATAIYLFIKGLVSKDGAK